MSSPSGAVTSEEFGGKNYGVATAPSSGVKVQRRSRCCCCYVARALILTLLILFMLAALALSVVAIGTGFQQYMTNYGSSVSIKLSLSEISAHEKTDAAPLVIWTGWHRWFDKNKGYQSLSALSFPSFVIGWVVLGVLAGSALLAFLSTLSLCCGAPGCLTSFFAIPFGLIMIGAMVAYYIIIATSVNRYAHQTYALDASIRVFQYPQWAWYFGIIAGALWFATGLFAFGLPSKTKTVSTPMSQV